MLTVEVSNAEIRQTIEDAGLKYWQVAEEIGITASTFTVWLRTPLTKERKKRVDDALVILLKQ